ncbi:4Fe-4S dicluster domain-containing protein [Desulfovibrio sp. SGI.169]|uniref:4Fe-4S dicluster domain-containing protein n=1 Tax=Desulfovibrio sp. SGI.169 TaxID=3420561 RepID=UPI003D0731CA
MSRIVFLEERCKGCRLCVEACPVHIIRPSGRFNRQGYEIMLMDGQCAGCAACAVMCPDAAIRVFRSVKGKSSSTGGAA